MFHRYDDNLGTSDDGSTYTQVHQCLSSRDEARCGVLRAQLLLLKPKMWCFHMFMPAVNDY